MTPLSMKSVLASYTLSLAVFIPDQRLDGRPVRHAPRLRLGDRPVHPGLGAVRPVDQHRHAGRLPRPAGRRRRHDGAGRPHDHGPHLPEIRVDPRHELRGDPEPDRPDAGAGRRRPDRALPALERGVLRQRPGRPARPLLRLSLPAGLPRGRHPSARRRRPDPVRRRHRAAVLRARSVRRTQPERGRDAGPARARRPAAGRLRHPRHPDGVSAADSRPVQDPHLPRGGERQLLHAARPRAASRSCSRCSTRSASASRRSSRACWSCRRPSPRSG